MRINGRSTSVEVIDSVEAENFLNENHRQKSLQNKTKHISYGLLFQGDLVAVAVFGSPRTSLMKDRYTSELLRLAFKRGVRIHGGASKLIKHYIKECKPADFFTYQDTSGEATAVYEHAGMTLVSQAKKKQYLVAPGKTVATGSRKEVLGMPYATRFGPDRILGIKLGEIYREDGSRKSNKDIFLEDLGWHIEETSGDRVYEWVDPNRTYYIYKITATDSDKYYYGVSHVKKANATIEDCLNDGYWGSGGKTASNKFLNWRLRHSQTLKKEILKIYPRRSQAFLAEKEVIGDLWREDPLCLNSAGGGLNGHIGSIVVGRINSRECSIHGKTKHIGDKCYSCSINNSISNSFCEIHGLTKHRGGNCVKCFRSKASTLKFCEKHGNILHYGGKCVQCHSSDNVSSRECPIHGKVKHIGDKCYSCINGKAVTLRTCSIHGKVKHKGELCITCQNIKSITINFCSIHGETKYKKDKCQKCSSAATFKEGLCNRHGSVKLRGEKCSKCHAEKVAHSRFHKSKPKADCVLCSTLEILLDETV